MQARDLVQSGPTAFAGVDEDCFRRTFGRALPRARFVYIDDCKAAYYVLEGSHAASSVDSHRVLMVHGIQTPALGLVPLATCLQKTDPSARLVLVELFGHGLSDTPNRPHAPALFHKLLDQVLNALSWQSADIIGYSFGALTTAGYLARSAERIRTLVLIAPAGFYRANDLDSARLESEDNRVVQEYVFELLEGPHPVTPDDWRERSAAGELIPSGLRLWQKAEHGGHIVSVVSMFRDGGVLDSHEMYEQAGKRKDETSTPVRVILGEEDDICSTSDFINRGFTDVHVIPEADHGVVRDKAAGVADLVASFWRSVQDDRRD
ncbi:Serine hydrolase-like protein [Sphaceloma murrayae]|uniref:Serine hydrolase-like protein n=1 Tax=Sphaceloma murrayae TaxID=2082308 RepID=A0A2K1QK05_9PEZI|nr:Serine hydrolase-like protein [Sphaceloma murrayae]